jgi:hypothetical protein
MHSTASSWLKRRSDHFARTEFYGPGGADLRMIMTFRDYRQSRESLSASGQMEDNQNQPLITKPTLGAMLEGFQKMAESNRKPSRTAYLALLEAAVSYSRERGGGGESMETLQSFADDGPRFLSEQGETGLGWKLAWCTWQDARSGGIDLGIDGLDLLIKVSLLRTDHR